MCLGYKEENISLSEQVRSKGSVTRYNGRAPTVLDGESLPVPCAGLTSMLTTYSPTAEGVQILPCTVLYSPYANGRSRGARQGVSYLKPQRPPVTLTLSATALPTTSLCLNSHFQRHGGTHRCLPVCDRTSPMSNDDDRWSWVPVLMSEARRSNALRRRSSSARFTYSGRGPSGCYPRGSQTLATAEACRTAQHAGDVAAAAVRATRGRCRYWHGRLWATLGWHRNASPSAHSWWLTACKRL